MHLPRWKLSQQRRTRRVKILIKLIFAIEKDPAIAGIKGPLSAYLIFSNKRRPIIQQERPHLAITEISKLIGEEWGILTPAQKETYQALANEEKANYQIKCEKARRLYLQANGAQAAAPEKPKAAPKQVEKKIAKSVADSSDSLSSVASDDAGMLKLFVNHFLAKKKPA